MHQKKKWVFCDNHIQRSLVKLGYSAINAEYSISFKIINKLLIGFIFSLLKVTYYYFLQFLFVQKKELKNKKAIFLKSGNGYDYANLYRVVDFDESKVVYINSFTMKSYMGVVKVGFLTLIDVFVRSFIVYCSVIKNNLPNNIENLVIENGLRNIAQYTYLSSFFKTVKSFNRDIHVYSGGAMLASNAAIDANLKTSYLLHGNIGRIHPIVFPSFDEVYVYSYDEKLFLESVGVRSGVDIYPFKVINSRNKLVLIFTRLNDEDMDFDELRNLVIFFKSYDYVVKFKPHPQYGYYRANRNVEECVYKWADILNIEVIDRGAGPASSLIQSTLPSFVVAWQSTALCESLSMGVIPISLSKKSDIASDIAYPIAKRTLSWHDEKKQIINAINKQTNYRKVLKSLNRKYDA